MSFDERKYQAEYYLLYGYERDKIAKLRRLKALSLFGNKCVKCGEIDIDLLDFDHIDPASKLYEIHQLFCLTLEDKLWEELKKCQLLCKSCHTKKTWDDRGERVEHGGGTVGKRDCPCNLCVAKRTEYRRIYDKTRKPRVRK